MRNDLVKRINHLKDKDNTKLVKKHFKKIRDDLDKSIELLDNLIGKKK
jgi:hypothetical protein